MIITIDIDGELHDIQIPYGYQRITEGILETGDKSYLCIDREFRDIDRIGSQVKLFYCVIRKNKKKNIG